ncbi:MAG TPA: DUF4031 domain-containing protein [Actinopolymorphaceae bacterium]
MTVYVDDMLREARVGYVTDRWSHLLADTREELHEFAARLGLKREWFQDHETRWHYDVTEAVRERALELGAQPISYPHGTARITMARRRS